MFSTLKAIEEYLEQEQPHDKTRSFYISGMGLCMRKRILQRMGKPCAETPDRTKRIFLAGRTNHALLQDILKKTGYLLEAEIPCEWEEFGLRGRADALAQTDDGLLLLEFKNTHSRKLLYAECDYHYYMQALTYLKLLNRSYNDGIKQARIVLISRDDWLVKEYGVFLTPAWDKAITDEVVRLKEFWDKQELPAELQEGSWECFAGKTYVCPYIEHCPNAKLRKESKNGLPPKKKSD